MTTAAHYLSLLLYVTIIFVSLNTLYFVNRCHKVRGLMHIVVSLLSISILQSVLFISLHIGMAHTDHYEYFKGDASLLWMLFDYFNGLALLMYVLSVHIYLRWRCSDNDCNFQRRRKTDP